jgi:hypothetical protein
MTILSETKQRLRSYRDHVIDEKRESNGEVFTPTELVQQILDHYPVTEFRDNTKTWIDHSCGNGQFLSEILIRKLENGSSFEQALQTIYGVDICEENIAECRERLLCGREDLRHIIEKNIVCADALRYHYRFDGTDPYETEQDQHFDSLFSMG